MIEAGNYVRHSATGQTGIVESVEPGWFTLLGAPDTHHDNWLWIVVAGLGPRYGDWASKVDDGGHPEATWHVISGYTYEGDECISVRLHPMHGPEEVLPREDVCLRKCDLLEDRAREMWPEVFGEPPKDLSGLALGEIVEAHFETVRQGATAARDSVTMRKYGQGLFEEYQADLAAQTSPTSAINPHHYTQWKFQPIEFITANSFPFWLGNVIKYACRADQKAGVEDLRKAQEYLQFRINELEGRKVTDNG